MNNIPRRRTMIHIFKKENYYVYSFPALKQKLLNRIKYYILSSLMERMPLDL